MANKKIPYRIYLTEGAIKRLTTLGENIGYSSGNEFAASMLDQYAELLAELEVAGRDAARRHQEQRIKELIKSMRESRD